MKIYVFFLIAWSVMPTMAQIPGYVPTSGLKGFWPFSGNANDYTINNNNGVVNGAVLSSDRFGNPNNAYAFNGTSDYIATSYAGILGSNPRAISFWAKTHSQAQMSAVSWGDNQQGNRFDGMFNYGATGVTIEFAYSAITYNSPSNSYDDTWHHYIFQFTNPGINQVEVYQDGVLLTQTVHVYNGTTIANTLSTFNVTFGRIYLGSSSLFFDGQLDDIGIWDRVLTPCEIHNLYTAITPTIGISAPGQTICTGQSSQLTASGGTNLLWSNSLTGPTISISPTLTTNYTVTGINGNGCPVNATITINVLKCTSVEEFDTEISFSIYPNPSNGKFSLKLPRNPCYVEVFNLAGKMIYGNKVSSTTLDINLSETTTGLIFIKVSGENGSSVKKLVIE